MLAELKTSSVNNTLEQRRDSIKKSVGRPTIKLNRKKLGFSLKGETSDTINQLVEETGLTKSAIIEQAIEYFNTREDIINKRVKRIEKLGDAAYLNTEDIINL